jgi:hypothetical protein
VAGDRTRQRLALRARQIRALYQRELTALHRDASVAPDDLPARERALWHEAAERLAELRRAVEQAGPLDDEERAAFEPPREPPSPSRPDGDSPNSGLRSRGETKMAEDSP